MKISKVNYEKLLSKKITLPKEIHSHNPITVNEAIAIAKQYWSKGNIGIAKEILQTVVTAVPKYAPIYFQLASALRLVGDKQAARAIMFQALDMSSLTVQNLIEAGIFFTLLNENEKAFELFAKAFLMAPNNPQVLDYYALTLIKKGESEKAKQCLLKAIAIDPGYAQAYLNLTLEDPDLIDQNKLERMLSAAESLPADAEDRAMFFYAAARKFAKQGDIAAEFSCLNKANATQRNRFPWDRQLVVTEWEETKAIFSADFVRDLPSENFSDITPIFFATLPRSGTTLMEQIISSHSQVCAAGESSLFAGSAKESSKKMWSSARYRNWLTKDNALDFFQLFHDRTVQTMTEQELNKQIVTDKSLNNYFAVGIVLAAFPKARVIYCLRDPLDVCLSCYQQYLPNGNPAATDLADMAFLYNIFLDTMNYWQSLFPDRILLVKYEELVLNPEKISRQMVEFCGLDWQDACLKFYENTNVVHTASLKQVQSPINTKGLNRWKKYATYLQPAMDELSKGRKE